MNTPNDQFDDASGQMPPSDESRAAEYVLGVLDADERRQVQQRIASEPAFAALVDMWEAHFAAWTLRVPPVQPSVHVWPRIRTRLGWPPVAAARSGVWNNASFWRTATALAVAASVAMIVIGLRERPPVAPMPPPVVVQPPPAEEAAARPVTVLARDDGTTAWIASVDIAKGKVLVVPVPSPADAGGRINELWIIPPGKAPLSLGLVSNEKAHTIALPDALRQAMAVGATLAVTLEPPEGIPHAAPTGPIIAKGDIREI